MKPVCAKIRSSLWRAVLALSMLAAPAFAMAQDIPEIARAKTLLDRAADALTKAGGGKARLAALSKAVTAHEVALAAYRAGLRRLAATEAATKKTVAADRARLEKLTAALQSIAQAPRSALLVHPTGPVSAARSAGLMAEILPLIDQRVTAFRLRVEQLRRLRSEQDAARVEVKGALAALQELRAITIRAVRRKRSRDLPNRKELAEQAKAASRKARTLSALAKTLKAASNAAAKPAVSFTEARGLIALPVAGEVTATFGQNDPWGREGQGLTIAAPAYAQVTAPWDGTVRYAGPLIDYGQVIVLEPEKGTLIVMAGLSRVDRDVGETVLAGERLGDLGGPIPASEDFLLEASADRDQIAAEKLYIELRRNGAAIDPAPWFDLTRKGSGG